MPDKTQDKESTESAEGIGNQDERETDSGHQENKEQKLVNQE